MGSRPRKRALLSLKSMLVMCVVLAVLFSANITDRSYRRTSKGTFGGGPGQILVLTVTNRGIPWTYRTESACFFKDVSTGDISKSEAPQGTLVDMQTHRLFMNVAAIVVLAVLLALTSERFVFSRWRRSRDAGGPRDE